MSRRIAFLAGAVLLPVAALAHVRLIHPSNGNPLHWSDPSNIGIVINSDGSSDLPDGSHETALRMAINDWNATSGTTAELVEDDAPASQARTDWNSSSIHLVLFDETNMSGFFPGGSSTVALTPVWFTNSGIITDADILFNGVDHHFTTSGETGRFDVQDVGAHELGHLLGLDHSGFAGSTMYPYLDPSVILHRSLSRDEEQGLRDAYPGGALGNITGTVRRTSDSTVVVGAYVAARDAEGRTVGTILTDSSGDFTLRGIDPGNYTVYAVPLGSVGSSGGAPVDAGNLGTGHTIQTDFEPAVFGSTAAITATETLNLGTLFVGSDVTLNLGTSADRFPIRIVEGTSQTVTLRGSGLLAPATLTASDPDILITNPMYFGSLMTFQVTVPADEANGHVDLTLVNSSGDLAILPGGLEITPPTPTVTSVTPGMGTRLGGTNVTVSGTEFKPGARIVIGSQIYTDGLGGTSVIGDTTILLTTAATEPGIYDVVVLDASGVEGRRIAGFEVADAPGVTSVFPEAGATMGGTLVTLTGVGFQPGASVSIDGVPQGPVTYVDSTTVSLVASPGAPGLQDLEIENPGGQAGSAVFTYVNSPDPTFLEVLPNQGTTLGGEVVTITGSGFSNPSEVVFGAHPGTGLGGTSSPSVQFIDQGTLVAVTPEHGDGPSSLLIRSISTDQAVASPEAYEFFLPPTASFSGSPSAGTYPLVVQFQDESSPGLTSWAWDFADGGISSTSSPSHTYTTAGTYTVTLLVSSPGGTDVAVMTDFISVGTPAPAAEFFAAPTGGEVPLTVAFFDESFGEITSHHWDFGDGFTSTAQSPIHTYSEIGEYSVALTVTGPGGLNQSFREDYISVRVPAPRVEFTASPVSGEAPLSVSFESQTTGAVSSLTWSFGDETGSQLAAPVHTYNLPGVYSVTLTALGPGGADSETSEALITVLAPPAPIASFEATPRFGTAPLSVTFEDTSQGAIYVRHWDFGDGTESYEQHPVKAFTIVGEYVVRLSVTGPGGTSSSTLRVFALQKGQPPERRVDGPPR